MIQNFAYLPPTLTGYEVEKLGFIPYGYKWRQSTDTFILDKGKAFESKNHGVVRVKYRKVNP